MRDMGFSVDASDLESLARRLERSALEFRVEVDKTLLEIGVELTAAAKSIAEGNSAKVAGSISMRQEPGRVVVRAGAEDLPIAELWEQGNRGSRASAATFRHPVFGSDTWVEQEKKPFLRPALRRLRPEVTRRMDEAWDRALGTAGLR